MKTKMTKTLQKKTMMKKTIKKDTDKDTVPTKSPVTNDKLYEGLICLDVKLSKLVDIMDKLYQIAEQKQTGGNNTLKTTSTIQKKV